jgi:transcriptional regulator with XRE-family HTH domain
MKYEITNEVKVLRYMRLQAGLSLKKAGRLIGVTDGAIGHLENGRMDLPLKRVEQMVQVYGFSMTDFLKMSRSKNIPVCRLTECQNLIKCLPNSSLELAYQYLKSLKSGGN